MLPPHARARLRLRAGFPPKSAAPRPPGGSGRRRACLRVPALGGARVALDRAFVALGGPFVALGGPFVALGGAAVALGGPFVAMGCAFVALGCAPASPPVAATGPGPEPGTAPAAVACEAVDVARGEAAFLRAKPFLEHLKHEEHPKIEVFEQGVRDLEEAARNGHLEGQLRFGSIVFGFAFTDHAPEPADQKDYVRAFTFLRIAALRGHARVLSSFPGLDAKRFVDLKLTEPLDTIPRAWLEQAFAKADAWMACAPAAAKIRYQAPPPEPEAPKLVKTDSGWTRAGDAEGPLLRVVEHHDGGAAAKPPITTAWLGALPALHACYAEWLRRDPQATATLVVSVKLPQGKVEVAGAPDNALMSCSRSAFAAVKLPPDAERTARLEIALYPRALSAQELGDARDGAKVERWEADGSCWMIVSHPCAPNKMCMADTRLRVRCAAPE